MKKKTMKISKNNKIISSILVVAMCCQLLVGANKPKSYSFGVEKLDGNYEVTKEDLDRIKSKASSKDFEKLYGSYEVTKEDLGGIKSKAPSKMEKIDDFVAYFVAYVVYFAVYVVASIVIEVVFEVVFEVVLASTRLVITALIRKFREIGRMLFS
ncbi:MAG: hypothetical protein CfP315_0331 [Candidatus Improbicoccus pseudotrichonymphae]|uniref:Uncharacterized protein n=1 Tax=Candidatus Improbicoccus pseudotrichonymphae TaxID=3033792 RepID=A0AA48L0T4_9FIRM|nr:MAG: hypothetical protein CfP315_0331 [Candidatus Improbicoccus pseudotrichonymphae]